jgi:hydrogenase maturation protein HypF
VTVAAVRRRVRIRVEGTVQGVGFRPYVHRLASEMDVAGLVLNDSEGVLVEAEADAETIERFVERLAAEAPPLAIVERLVTSEIPAVGDDAFAIAASRGAGPAAAPVSADTATCPDCLAELSDPVDRRYRYPFINCTNCGPRFTIVTGIPYDRPLTTMAGFAMCAECRREYEDPADRRFHAEPNACPLCGPRVSLAHDPASPDPIAAAAAALREGAIVAVKGVGGFHLACRADDEAAVGALRARKHREEKPFALMVRDANAADELVVLGPGERDLLESRARPIVLADRRAGARVAVSVAPGAPQLGVMAPYSPLHHLLLADAGTPLVMTSGNVSDEPIAYRDEDALERLAGIADVFLLHDRPIATRTDDSVVRVVDGRPGLVRRSRGHVPASLALPVPARRPLLACGAHLKNTFCVAKGERAWVSHHIGDLESYETLTSFVEGIAHFEKLFDVSPAVVAHDLHPEYLSTKYALERDGAVLVAVQHHHAHLAAVLAEHGQTAPAIGAIYDGAGLGTDGTIWGGEILAGDLAGCDRLGHLWPVRQPGGDAAARQPWRMACSWLEAAGEPPPPALIAAVGDRAWRQVSALVDSGLASPLTSSMGRLFDAVAALCGLRTAVTYEGQAAIELEAACAPGDHGVYPCDGLDARPVVAAVARDVRAAVPVARIAARFHDTIAAATARVCADATAARGLTSVVLAGGVFQNRRLLAGTARCLCEHGLRVVVAERLPTNDGAIAYGQAAVAAAREADVGAR